MLGRSVLFMLFILVIVGLAMQEAYAESKDTPISNVPAVVITAKDEEDLDPIETFNRGMFTFNESVDELFLSPVARGYRAFVPEWGRERIGNALNNLSSPVTFANSLIQGDVDYALTIFWRFTINSTIGIGGLFDTATQVGLEYRGEDFGQTLGVYGVGSGPYIVLPILGPTTGRDAVGKVVDSFSNPFNYLDPGAVLVIQATETIDTREGLLDYTDDVYDTSFDPYATIRSAYIQHRNDEIANGNGKDTD